MIDCHVHIGQWSDRYYDYPQIFDTVLASQKVKIDGLVFSSTSSCIFGVKYSEIEAEIGAIYSANDGKTEYSSDVVKPLLWYVPEYRKQSVSVETAMKSLPYCGIKIHPRAHNWDLNDSEKTDILHEIFDFASQNNVPLLIHSGYDEFEEARKFERFFKEYQDVKVVLAHCRPIEQTVEMLSKYQNVYADSSFVDQKSLNILKGNGLTGKNGKLFFGTDFPITHWYATEMFGRKTDFEKEYEKDCASAKYCLEESWFFNSRRGNAGEKYELFK